MMDDTREGYVIFTFFYIYVRISLVTVILQCLCLQNLSCIKSYIKMKQRILFFLRCMMMFIEPQRQKIFIDCIHKVNSCCFVCFFGVNLACSFCTV